MPLDYLPMKRKFFGHYSLDFGAGAIIVTAVLYVIEAGMEYSYHYCGNFFTLWAEGSNENVVLPYIFLIFLEVHALILLITGLGFACGLCVGSIECAPFFVVALITAPFIITLYYVGMLCIILAGKLECPYITPIYGVHLVLMILAAIFFLHAGCCINSYKPGARPPTYALHKCSKKKITTC
ncbi:uncharacterized protein LOC113240298 [Hyposmocoma kahamanoa]|uniref:uncharacterized protein LOC113240298 n=1 Tax=Hyposmocoma kahamanoa TaxID=1477025 RepID=UPI000E6D87F8|nr:uncharacterized protein LOC113240298 [Hyposmocoma kahamanoa]XP_026333351.1 uncharacterized protein LOC113240298 [Hyposmocoma kahamanoa]